MAFIWRYPYETVFAQSAPNSPDTDGFGRLRVAPPSALFDSMGEYGDDTFYWETKTSGGTVARVANQCAVRLSTGGTTADQYAYRQTRQYLRYQPGRSLNIEQTFVMSAAVTNARARIGYFDASNGIFFERNDSTFNIVRRTNVTGTPTDTTVAQSSWNVDKLDGTGPSGQVLDVTKTQILAIQLQYLGVGRVQVGFNIDGRTCIAHEFLNANNLSTAYMSTGCLPIRAEVYNTGTASGTLTMDMVCQTASSGGLGANRKQFSRSNAITAISTSTTMAPIISVRAATLLGGTTGGGAITNRGHIIPQSIDFVATGQVHEYELLLNTTLGGGTSWQANNAASLADYDVASTTVSGGTILDSGYVAASATLRTAGIANLFTASPLVYTGLNSTQDVLTLAARTVTGSGTMYGAMTWEEEY